MSLQSSMPSYFLIPDTLRNWPWPRHLNLHYAVCKEESAAWCESFNAFSPKAQRAFNRCDFNLLASLAFPRLDKDGCRIGCDLMNLFFVFDEYSDVAAATEVRKQADIIMDALRNPTRPRPKGEWVGGEVARQFWENAIKTTTLTAQRRFIDTFQLYTDSVVQQAADRDHSHIRSVDHYFDLRRDTIGAKPSFAILEVKMDLPDEVLNHPSIVTLTAACIDMLIIGNDLCSYNVEQARGDDGHNLVTIVMHERKCDLISALKWISGLHDDLVEKFLSTLKAVPSFGNRNLDEQVSTYVDGLGNWVRANDTWSFESERYFGKKGLEIQQSRLVKVLPKEVGESAYQYVTPTSVQRKSPLHIFPSIWRENFQIQFLLILLGLLGLCLVVSPSFVPSLANVSPFET
ncbi:Delta(6)-protoilludene synthase [Cerrena zonata]|uniref:Terpene synthase n=1 Tax=Cerrena zonata TaxID=2478898 RepID=A0AAW0GTU9_9APHY